MAARQDCIRVCKERQKAPPLAGELSVNDSEQTEGGMLKQLSISEPFPFRHGYAATLSP